MSHCALREGIDVTSLEKCSHTRGQAFFRHQETTSNKRGAGRPPLRECRTIFSEEEGGRFEKVRVQQLTQVSWAGSSWEKKQTMNLKRGGGFEPIIRSDSRLPGILKSFQPPTQGSKDDMTTTCHEEMDT